MSWAAFELRILANRSESWRISLLVVNNVLYTQDPAPIRGNPRTNGAGVSVSTNSGIAHHELGGRSNREFRESAVKIWTR
jgi:hypothetical protein